MTRVRIHLLLLIVALTFIFEAQNLAEADHKLMRQLCHNSETPETCMRCVKLNPKAEKANDVKIATIVVNCIRNQAHALAANLTRLASHTSDTKLKSLYQICGKRYSSTKKELFPINQYLKIHNYDKAELCVVRALGLVQDCYETLMNRYRTKVPDKIFFYSKIYAELSEAACRILEKLY